MLGDGRAKARHSPRYAGAEASKADRIEAREGCPNWPSFREEEPVQTKALIRGFDNLGHAVVGWTALPRPLTRNAKPTKPDNMPNASKPSPNLRLG